MEKEILNWEAVSYIEEALVDGLADEQLQKILDAIYGSGMFRIIDSEELKKILYENKKVISSLNISERSLI